ncbi:MAG: hypothetical protein ACLRMW_06290 [[Clostridium] symbiosum]
MIGDGINDSPAADAELPSAKGRDCREIADITISEDSLFSS